MTKSLPPIPHELKYAFGIYVQDFEDNLAIFLQKNCPEAFSFSEKEQKDFQQRFHRLKGSSSFFYFKEIIKLANEGEIFFNTIPQFNDFPKYKSLCHSLSNYLISLKTETISLDK